MKLKRFEKWRCGMHFLQVTKESRVPKERAKAADVADNAILKMMGKK